MIEKLRSEDINELLELYKELMQYSNTEEQAKKIYNEMLKDDKYLVLVAKEKGKIVGSALAVCCMLLGYEGRNFLVIEDVIVKSEFRGLGIGSKLMKSIDEFAMKSNCGYSILVSKAYMKKAHEFYENLGFTEDVRGFKKYY